MRDNTARGLASVTAIAWCVLALIVVSEHNRIDKLEDDVKAAEIVLCGLRQFEDGSILVETDDQVRMSCILEAGK